MDDHSISPPPELVEQWANASPMRHSDESWAYEMFIAHHAARWGSDIELAACCEYIESRCIKSVFPGVIDELCEARRPSNESIKQKAIRLLDWAEKTGKIALTPEAILKIRAALMIDDSTTT